MVKRFLLIPLMIVLVSGLIFGGCAAPAPAPAPVAPGPGPTPSPAPGPAAPAPAPAAKVITMRYCESNPPDSSLVINLTANAIKLIENAAKGAIKINMYPAETLTPGKDTWDAISSGIADIGRTDLHYKPGMASLIAVMNLPFMPVKNDAQASGILWKLYEEFPEIRDQLAECKVLGLNTVGPYWLLTKGKQVTKLEDLDGMVLMNIKPGVPSDVMRSIGVRPEDIPFYECYQSLEKGVVDGIFAGPMAIMVFRLQEVMDYYTAAPFWQGIECQAMNMDTWNSLPADVQRQLDAVIGEQMSVQCGGGWGETEWSSTAIVEEETDVVHNYLSDAEVAKLADVAMPLWQVWVDELEAEGLPAQAVLDRCLELCETYVPPMEWILPEHRRWTQ